MKSLAGYGEGKSFRSWLTASMCFASLLLLTLGCGQPAAANNSDTIDGPEEVGEFESLPMDPMAGTWRVSTPINLIQSNGIQMGTLQEARFRFNEDKTWECVVRAQLKAGGPSSDRSGSFKGFWTLEGRKLTIENPDSLVKTAVIMMNEDMQSFDWSLTIPDTAVAYDVRFVKE